MHDISLSLSDSQYLPHSLSTPLSPHPSHLRLRLRRSLPSPTRSGLSPYSCGQNENKSEQKRSKARSSRPYLIAPHRVGSSFARSGGSRHTHSSTHLPHSHSSPSMTPPPLKEEEERRRRRGEERRRQHRRTEEKREIRV